MDRDATRDRPRKSYLTAITPVDAISWPTPSNRNSAVTDGLVSSPPDYGGWVTGPLQRQPLGLQL